MKAKYGQWKEDTMQRVRRFWYVFAGVILALSLLLGFRVSGLLLSSHPSGPTRSRSSAPLGTASPHPEASTQVQLTQQLGTLVIPSIRVNAPIESVGRFPDGTMAVPVHKQWDGVGWYQDGPRPGEPGSAVIDGHLDRPGGSPAVFWRLHELHVGDIVLVVTPGKHTLRFQVRRIAAYQPAVAPLQQIFENHAGTFLNLITCAGTWLPRLHQTTLRLVVYTVLL